MADADIQIKAVLDAEEAKRKAEELGQSAESAGQSAGNAAREASSGLGQAAESAGSAADAVADVGDAAQDAAGAAQDLGDAMSDSLRKAGGDAQELSRRLDGVADSVGKINARQLIGVAGNIAGMGMDVWDAMHPGQSARSTVAGGAIQGGFSGAAMGMAFGPWGALLGALGGAGLGAFTNAKRQENAEAAEKQAQEAIVAANREYVQTMMDAIAHTRDLNEFFERLGDTSRSVAERQAEAAARLASLEGRQKELSWAMVQSDVLSDPKRLREITAEYQRNAAEIDRIKNVDIREERTRDETVRTVRERTEQITRRTQVETDALARLGINSGPAQDSRAVESIDQTVKEVLRELKLLPKEGNITVWQ